MGLRFQRFQKSTDSGFCVYHMPDGRRCAVGWIIRNVNVSDEHLSSSIDFIKHHYPQVAKLLAGLSESWLGELQEVHDRAIGDEIRARLLKFATKHELTATELDP